MDALRGARAAVGRTSGRRWRRRWSGTRCFRRRLIQDLQLEGVLRAAGEIERGQEHVVAAVQGAGDRRRPHRGGGGGRAPAAGGQGGGPALGHRAAAAPVAADAARALAGGGRRCWPAGAAALVLLRPRDRSGPTASPPTAQRGRAGAACRRRGRGDIGRAPFPAPGTRRCRAREPVDRPPGGDRGPGLPARRPTAPGGRRRRWSWPRATGSRPRARRRARGWPVPGGSRVELRGRRRSPAARTGRSRAAEPGARPARRPSVPGARAGHRGAAAGARAAPRWCWPRPTPSSPATGTVRLDVGDRHHPGRGARGPRPRVGARRPARHRRDRRAARPGAAPTICSRRGRRPPRARRCC